MNDTSKLFDLSGQTAALTGAASGIGRSTAITLASAGANVVLGDIDEAGLKETARYIEDTGGRCVTVRTDVTKRDDLRGLVQRAVSEFGQLDIMGNIAGVPVEAMVVDMTEEILDRSLNINLKGVVYGCQEAMAVMTPRRSGNIINIASGVIDAPGAPGWAPYAMAKAGVAMLSKVLAREAAPYGIRVNCLAPGVIVTAFTSRHWKDQDQNEDLDKKQAFIDGLRKTTPLGMEGKPEHIAHAILYLVSEAGELMTGQILHPNGGSLMPW